MRADRLLCGIAMIGLAGGGWLLVSPPLSGKG